MSSPTPNGVIDTLRICGYTRHLAKKLGWEFSDDVDITELFDNPRVAELYSIAADSYKYWRGVFRDEDDEDEE